MDAECEYILDENKCVYSDCFAFKNEEECEQNMNGTNNYLMYAQTWNIFCEWRNDLGICNRVSCGGNILPECANSAVRKPLFDTVSICNGWFCDCTTVNNAETAQWTVTDTSILLDAIDSEYDFETYNNNALIAQYINTDKLSLFEC